MGNVDGVPLASQLKTVVQASRGDREGAWQTQSRFTERCVGAAQIRSLVEALRGDVDAAAETQRRFLENSRRLLDSSEIVDAVPGLAQFKSGVHLARDEVEQARDTHERFLNYCPLVSQAKSVVQAASGRKEEAIQTQRDFLDFTSKSLDKVPLIGHAKALLHHRLGDQDRAEQAMEEANRSAERGRQLFGEALQDIFQSRHPRSPGQGATSSPSSSSAGLGPCATPPGPLGDQEIREHTLCFRIAPEQVTSHGACPICMQDFHVGDSAITMQCFHVFHTPCAERWLRQCGSCPVCRVPAMLDGRGG